MSSGALLSNYFGMLIDTLKTQSNYTSYHRLGAGSILHHLKQQAQNLIKRTFNRVIMEFRLRVTVEKLLG